MTAASIDAERVKEIARSESLEHAAECWGKDGAGYEVREAVFELRSWVKGVGIALVVLQLVAVGGTVVKWFAPAIPTARAEVAK